MVRGEEAALSATTTMMTTRRLTSLVWVSYTLNRPADGGLPTATCLECGLTLCAGGSNGTSHLRRHTKSNKCRQLATERERELCFRRQQTTSSPTAAAAADEPSPADDDEEDPFTMNGIYIPELYDKLIAEGLLVLDNIVDQSREPAEHFSAASNYVPAVAQATRSSTRWFINKTKERRQVKKAAENKKRCAPDDESGLHVPAQPDFNLRAERTLSDLARHRR